MRENTMEKTDIRIRFTRKTLRESLVALMKEKPILNITIKEICDRAGLSRSTFYTYYKDQYELLRQIEDDTFIEARKVMQPHVDLARKPGKVNAAVVFQDLLQYIAGNSNSIQVLLSENGDSAFQKRFFRDGVVEIHQFAESAGHREGKRIVEYGSVFFIGGMLALVQEWLKNGMDTPVPEMAKIIAKFTVDALR
jgi:AcrR family transcriptional regulator